MSEPIEVGDAGVEKHISSDPEKTQHDSTSERWGDQIPHEMLEVLAPNGEGDYVRNYSAAAEQSNISSITRQNTDRSRRLDPGEDKRDV